MSHPSVLKRFVKQLPVLGNVIAERDRLQQDIEAVSAERDRLQQDVEAVSAERDRLQQDVEKLDAELVNLHHDCSHFLILEPKSSARNKLEFFDGIKNSDFSILEKMQSDLISISKGEEFFVKQFCLCCNKATSMLVDYQYSFMENQNLVPNWRERLACPECQMNNRQRLVAKLVQQHIRERNCSRIYFMEQITPIFKWVKSNYPELEIFGSEYLGHEYSGGEVINGIRHEDVMNMSFETRSIDLIVSNDVFEHVPDFSKALQECARVLSSNGLMIATIPFDPNRDKSEVRAKIINNHVNFILPAQYHGNPLSEEGCLVFHDFGWDVLEEFSEAGFSSTRCEVYADHKFGHFGRGQIVFKAESRRIS
ncbi:class I SAM-dependent methyltransferase [Nitrosospira multiformis]|uniref:class I SAM-dependent methyltransferase n=1 Tax=Nitrosospira multiformis TaxID=1231 RepID=UPI000895697F|nr:class I SAM-dependent methyltransferase [Nitrosospira multiformis]SEA43271.1 Methyltransferase domain-containing protein [Nitrosospira multiformis]